MKLTNIRAGKLVTLTDFTSAPLQAIAQSDHAPIAVLEKDKLLFYVVHPEEWDRLNSTVNVSPIKSIEVEIDGQFPESTVQIKQITYPRRIQK